MSLHKLLVLPLCLCPLLPLGRDLPKQGREKLVLCCQAVITMVKGGEVQHPAVNLEESLSWVPLPAPACGCEGSVMSLVAGDALCSFSALGCIRSWALHNMKSFRDKGGSERREKFCCSLETPPVMLKYPWVSLYLCWHFSEGSFQP